ncbi:MAG: rhodanese-related sulfurtransferase [Rickettsiales bacterium]|jgi:rhodanese-related sulfurtransferase
MVLQIEVLDAWKFLQENPQSILVDVRTREEIDFVGFADLSEIDIKTIFLPWRQYPRMEIDEDFTDKLSGLVAETFPSNPLETNLLFLCRSGSRSFEAAMFVSDLDYVNCKNVVNGFEGSCNQDGQRGKINGWKSKNLSWKQN